VTTKARFLAFWGGIAAISAPRARPPPPGIWERFVANKGSYSNRCLGGPCVAPGWPLGGPSVTQSQTQSQSGRGSQIHQVPITTYQVPFLSKIGLPAAWAAGSRNTSTPSELYRILFAFVKSHSNSRKYGRQRPKKPQDDFGVTRPLNLRKSCGARFAFRHSLRNVYSCLGDGSLCESHRHPELSSHSGIE
jgi:hypothetical protein